MSWSVGRDCKAVLQNQWMGNVAVQAKTVRFEIGTVWCCREEMYRDIVSPVRSHWQVEGFRQPGNFHKDRDAAAVSYVRLGEGYAAGLDHLRKLVQRMQVLARCYRHAALAYHPRVPKYIVWDGRLFQPINIQRLERTGGAYSCIRRATIRENLLADFGRRSR